MSSDPSEAPPASPGWYEQDAQVRWWDGQAWSSGDYSVSPGWYEEGGLLRWWDGQRWTEHRQAASQPSAEGGQQRAPVWLLVTIAICVGVAGVFGMLTVSNLLDDGSTPTAGQTSTSIEPEPQTEETYPQTFTSEDVIRATCKLGGYFDHASTCTQPANGFGSIIYGVHSSQFNAENALAKRSQSMAEYVIIPLTTGEYFTVEATEDGALQPLEDQYGLVIQNN